MMEFSRPQSLTALYRITTPMFLGGDDQQADGTHFRNASFKGALRFWWRALNWGRVLRESGGDSTQALRALHEQEGALFGLASDGKYSRQSAVQISSTLSGTKRAEKGTELPGLDYLLGQGLYHFKQKALRSYLQGGEVAVTLHFKPGTPAADTAAVRQAAIALGLFGGLGSRARSGLGSLALQSLRDNDTAAQDFTTEESLKDFIATQDFTAPPDAPLSAFTQGTRIDLSLTAPKALDALSAVGKEMQLYRSYGQKGKVGNQPARRNFVADHDNALAATQGQPLQRLPKRAVFGLPHNYFFSSTGGKLDLTAEKEGRRAAPLLVHIHALQDGRFAAIQTLLPGVFLPAGMKADAKVKGRSTSVRDTAVDFDVIARYLDGFTGNGRDFPNFQTLRAPRRG